VVVEEGRHHHRDEFVQEQVRTDAMYGQPGGQVVVEEGRHHHRDEFYQEPARDVAYGGGQTMVVEEGRRNQEMGYTTPGASYQTNTVLEEHRGERHHHEHKYD